MICQQKPASCNKQSVDGKLAGYEKLYTSLSQLGISGSTTTLANVWDKMDNNSEAKLDKNVFTDTMPNTDSAFILIEKLTVARGRITYYTKDNASTYFMYLNSSNVPSGTWQRLVTESDLENYKNVSSITLTSLRSYITINSQNNYGNEFCKIFNINFTTTQNVPAWTVIFNSNKNFTNGIQFNEYCLTANGIQFQLNKSLPAGTYNWQFTIM